MASVGCSTLTIIIIIIVVVVVLNYQANWHLIILSGIAKPRNREMKHEDTVYTCMIPPYMYVLNTNRQRLDFEIKILF